jgi:hypothetical protein
MNKPKLSETKMLSVKFYRNLRRNLFYGIVLHVNVGFFSRAIEMRRKRNIGAECECIVNSMVTFLKFLLTYIMKFIKIYSIK